MEYDSAIKRNETEPFLEMQVNLETVIQSEVRQKEEISYINTYGHLRQRVDSLEKTDAGRDWGQEEKGTTEDEIAGWHLGLDGRESE